MVKGSQLAGVKPISIAGRFVSERERLVGMTDEERAFRKQWLKDQHLAKGEPRHVPEMYKATYNPIRRFYRAPLNAIFSGLTPALGAERAKNWRYFTGKAFLGIFGIYCLAYYFKYNTNDWTRAGGVKVLRSRSATLPGDEGYPGKGLSDRHVGADYASRGFKEVKLNL